MNFSKDFEYLEALRFCLEKTFSNKKTLPDPLSIDLNVVKPLINYIRGLSQEPEDFVFSKPVYAWWDLTSACNFRCIHCLYNDRDYSDKQDLTPKQAMNLANELIEDLEISCITLTGGEIFLRKDAIDIIKLFKANNVAVRLATNAALLDTEKINTLASILNPYTDIVQVSLDGAYSETFKKIRLTDTYEKILDNIANLVKNGVSVNVAYTVNNINDKEVLDAYKICNDLGVKTFYAGKLSCFNDSHRKLALSDRDLIVLYSQLNKTDFSDFKTELRSNFFSIPQLLNLPYSKEILKEEKFVKYFEQFDKPIPQECNLHDKISIRSDGRVYMCMQAELCSGALMGNYKENSLLEIWEKRFGNVLFQKREIKGCSNCKYNVVCNAGCKAVAMQNFNNQDFPEIKCKFLS